MYLLEKSGEDIGGWLVFSKKKGPFNRVIVPPFTPYTSLLTPSPLPESAIHGSDNDYARLLDGLAGQFDSMRFHLHPAWQDVRLFQWSNWTASPLYTYTLDLAQFDPGLSSWSESARRTFRKHADAYAFSNDNGSEERIIELNAQRYRKSSRPIPASPARTLQLVQQLERSQLVRAYSVQRHDEQDPSGGLLVVRSETEAYYWLAGSVPGPAMTVLLGRLLPLLKSEGIRTFDFVGANTQSIAEFKRRLGPTLTPYFALTCNPNRWFAMFQAGRRLSS
jgi:hypothetical protein